MVPRLPVLSTMFLKKPPTTFLLRLGCLKSTWMGRSETAVTKYAAPSNSKCVSSPATEKVSSLRMAPSLGETLPNELTDITLALLPLTLPSLRAEPERVCALSALASDCSPPMETTTRGLRRRVEGTTPHTSSTSTLTSVRNGAVVPISWKKSCGALLSPGPPCAAPSTSVSPSRSSSPSR